MEVQEIYAAPDCNLDRVRYNGHEFICPYKKQCDYKTMAKCGKTACSFAIHARDIGELVKDELQVSRDRV